VNEQKHCACGKSISRKALRCHGCANKRPRPGRRTVDVDLPVKLYGRLASVVKHAIARCTNPAHAGWRRYGGRGIKVYPSWVADPASFVRHLLTLPGHDDPALVIDREDNSKGYEPGNVRFVTRSVSLFNRDSWGTPVTKAGDVADALTVLSIEGNVAVCRCRCGKTVRRVARGIRFPKTYLQCQSCANQHSRRGVPQLSGQPRTRLRKNPSAGRT
jgi:hypothetical protein